MEAIFVFLNLRNNRKFIVTAIDAITSRTTMDVWVFLKNSRMEKRIAFGMMMPNAMIAFVMIMALIPTDSLENIEALLAGGSFTSALKRWVSEMFSGKAIEMIHRDRTGSGVFLPMIRDRSYILYR